MHVFSKYQRFLVLKLNVPRFVLVLLRRVGGGQKARLLLNVLAVL